MKKPDEFNRPRIEPKDRLIPRKKSYSTKKVSRIKYQRDNLAS